MHADVTPYADDVEYLEDVLTLVSLRLHREVCLTRALRGDGRQESFLGLFLSDQEVDAMLSELHGHGRQDPGASAGTAAQLDRLIHERKARIITRVAATRRPLPPQRLAATFGLGNPEVDLVLYLMAAEVDDRFGRVYGFLHDDVGRKRLSPGLAYRLLEGSFPSLADFRGVLHPSAPLIRERIVMIADDSAAAHLPLLERPLRIEDRVADFLLGRVDPDRALDGLIEIGTPEVDPEYALLVRSIRSDLESAGGTVALWLHRDADADLWAGSLAAALRLRVVSLDWRGVAALDSARLVDIVDRAAREARLQDALLHLHHLDDAPDAALRAVSSRLRGTVCLSARRERAWNELGTEVIHVEAPPLSIAARTSRWAAALTEEAGAAKGERLDNVALGLAATYPFTIREMRSAVRSTPDRAAARDPGELGALVSHECKRLASLRMEGAAQKVSTPFRFDDLVLPEGTLELLQDLTLQHRHASKVLDEWGLGRRFHQAEGSNALFMGPPGTGKTMAASVVANELGLELFRVDLAGVVSKYIGETEKNLDRIFDAASRARIVLFIDEADALFGKRSEVKDAHDRYANIEVSFLLQRMEAYDGIAILATNLSQNIDEAFFRRIRSVVEFPMPGPPDRLRLWERLIMSDAPLHDDVDLSLLAERFELSGGHIRNCILTAALHAAAAGGAIHMHHLMRAVGREYTKMGRPLSRNAFGHYYAAVRRNGSA